MKRWSVLLVALAAMVSLTLVACGGDGGEAPAPEESPTEEASPEG